MDIVKICAVGIITAFSILILKETKSEAGIIVGIAGGVIILLMLVEYLTDIISVVKSIAEKSGIGGDILLLVFKIVGVGYIAEFSAGIIEDAGSKALADKVVLGGKIIITVLSLPIIVSLFNIISAIVSG